MTTKKEDRVLWSIAMICIALLIALVVYGPGVFR